jgi:hypothetical protein
MLDDVKAKPLAPLILLKVHSLKGKLGRAVAFRVIEANPQPGRPVVRRFAHEKIEKSLFNKPTLNPAGDHQFLDPNLS